MVGGKPLERPEAIGVAIGGASGLVVGWFLHSVPAFAAIGAGLGIVLGNVVFRRSTARELNERREMREAAEGKGQR